MSLDRLTICSNAGAPIVAQKDTSQATTINCHDTGFGILWPGHWNWRRISRFINHMHLGFRCPRTPLLILDGVGRIRSCVDRLNYILSIAGLGPDHVMQVYRWSSRIPGYGDIVAIACGTYTGGRGHIGIDRRPCWYIGHTPQVSGHDNGRSCDPTVVGKTIHLNPEPGGCVISSIDPGCRPILE